MKKQLPLAIGLVVGMFALLEFYIPWHPVGTIQTTLLDWGQILAAAAFVLGGINVIQVNYPKIRRRDDDWQYKVILLGGAVVMALVGVKWHSFGGDPDPGSYTVVRGAGQGATVRVAAREGAMVKVGPQRPQPWVADEHGTFEVPLAPGPNKVKVFMGVAGYQDFHQEIWLLDDPLAVAPATPTWQFLAGRYGRDVVAGPGDVVIVRAPLATLWGPSGRLYTWLYDHVFAPCNATMFALLAFFIASAAFRAFRARNAEAALLLGAAILIMLGRVPIGRAMSDVLPQISDWILSVPNNAGRRAIMMGAALGAIATSLRVILGLERSHLGSD
jgi:hypothetical protein